LSLPKLRRAWLIPLFFFQAYLSLTVYFFFYGPWPWEIKNTIQLLAYLIFVQISILVGYFSAWFQIKKASESVLCNNTPFEVRRGVYFLRQSFYFTLIMIIPSSLSRTGQFIPDVVAGLTNTGAVYNDNYERLIGGNAYVLVEYLRMLLSPWLIALFPLTVVYWTQLSNWLRFGCSFAVLANLSLYIATGTNKGLADFVVTGPWLIYLAVSTGMLNLKIKRSHLALVFIVLFYGFLEFFGSSQSKREGNVGEFGAFNTGVGLIQADAGMLGDFLNDNFRIIYESLTRYVVQGYYALSLSMQVDQSSTLGFGHSMFLARNADMVFGTNYFTAGSLPGLVEANFGWSMTALWHSIYPWLASDFGFVGSIVVMGFFSYLLSLSWGMSLCTLGYRWISMAFMMLVLFFYIPANNQIFQSGETCVGFVLVLISILMSRKRRLVQLNAKMT
jgi:hypothetical protein